MPKVVDADYAAGGAAFRAGRSLAEIVPEIEARAIAGEAGTDAGDAGEDRAVSYALGFAGGVIDLLRQLALSGRCRAP